MKKRKRWDAAPLVVGGNSQSANLFGSAHLATILDLSSGSLLVQ